jgi:hypothetical protein
MDLYEILQLAKRNNRQLLVILGDGIDPVLELRRTLVDKIEDERQSYRGYLREKDRENWLYYEGVRNLTRNVQPSPSYFFIFLLARLGILQAIITTNYDMTLDAIFGLLRKDLPVPVVFNPILDASEEDYSEYSHQKSSSSSIRIWKIHGSLSHIICRKCKTILRCPDFILPFDVEQIAAKFMHPISHIYLPGRVKCCPISVKRENIKESLCGHYVHPVDWNLPRFSQYPIFRKIIDGGLNEFNDNPFGVIIIGFKGLLPPSRRGDHEEINVALEKLDGKGILWAMLVSREQGEKIRKSAADAHLWELVERNNGMQFSGETDEIADKLMLSLNLSGLITSRECNNLFRKTFEPIFVPRKLYPRFIYK